MRRNADRYHRVSFAARMVVVALALLLGFVVWRFSRRLYGPRGALLSLGFYSFSAETLAHGGITGTDLPTALGILATIYGFYRFVRPGRASWGALAAGSPGRALPPRLPPPLPFP